MSRKSGLILISWPGGSQHIESCGSSDILSAALNAGIPVPHSCRSAVCLQCSAYVLESEDPSLEPGARVELCKTPARSGGTFEIGVDPYNSAASVRIYPAKVVELARVARDTMMLRLLTPRNQVVESAGGQYACIMLGSGIARNYSIAGVYPTSRIIDFYIRLVSGGKFSSWLSTQASVGDVVRIRAPFGTFGFKRQLASNTLFVATGTGIVPIFAMLRSLTLADREGCGELFLVWGNRSREDLFLKDELDSICARLGISQVLVFSQEEQLHRRRVTEVVAAMELKGASIYVAGNPNMVRDVQIICQSKGVYPRLLHTDAFTFDRAFVGGER